MKKLLFTLAVVFTTSFAFANNDENGDINNNKPKTKNVTIVETEDDALHCSIKITNSDGTTTTYSYWFCDCSELKSLIQSPSTNTSIQSK